MALEKISLEERAPAGSGGLSALRDLAYSGQLPQLSLDMLPKEVSDPGAKWESFAAGMLKPTSTGTFGESVSNAFGALAEGRNREAELRAKYLPLVAQALLQRQLQAAQIAQMQWKLAGEFDQSGVSALVPLLTKQGDLTGADVSQALGAAVQRGLMPAETARQLYSTLPTTDPQALRDAINRLSIGKLNAEQSRGAVTPKVSLEDTGDARQAVAVPPGQPGQAGPVGVSVPKSLTPGERVGAIKPEKDQAGNPYFLDSVTGTAQYPNQGAPKLGIAGGAPGPGGVPPQAAPPAGPPMRTVAGNEMEKEEGQRYSKYAGELSGSLDAMRSMQQRIAEMRKYAADFQPGATAQARMQLGRFVKDLGTTLGLSPEQADAITRKISSGDISSAQAFEKLSAQGAMEALKASMQNPGGASVGRATQAEFAVFLKNNPNIATDPQALDKMFNFLTKQYQMKSVEQREFDHYMKSNRDPTGWDATWNQRAQELGFVTPSIEKNTARGSTGTPSKTSAGVSASGKPMKLTKDGWVYE